MSRVKFITLIAVPLVVAGALAYAHQDGGHHTAMRLQQEQHLERFAGMLAKVEASDAQKVQIDGLLRGAFVNVGALRDGHHAALGQMHELLFAPSIDRARIEALRAEQIRSLDQASKDLVAAFQAAAEVLSAEQRAALAQEMRRIHGG